MWSVYTFSLPLTSEMVVFQWCEIILHTQYILYCFLCHLLTLFKREKCSFSGDLFFIKKTQRISTNKKHLRADVLANGYFENPVKRLTFFLWSISEGKKA